MLRLVGRHARRVRPAQFALRRHLTSSAKSEAAAQTGAQSKGSFLGRLTRGFGAAVLYGGVITASTIGASYAAVGLYHALELDDGSHPRIDMAAQSLEAQQRAVKLSGTLAYAYLQPLAMKAYLLWRNVDATDEELQEDLAEAHEANAKRVLNTITSLGGIYVKFGQEMSLMRGILPDQYCSTLSVLQDEVPHVGFEDVQRVIEEDFRMPLDKLFSSFEEEPFAAASLAQVHRAKLTDGTPVAVKVQYPKVGHFLAGDLLSYRLLSQIIAKLNSDFKYDEKVNKNVREHLHLELDFVHEMANARKCKENFRNDKHVYVPRSYEKLTSKRVLTMEFVEGCKANDLETMAEWGIQPKEVATIILSALGRQMFEHGFVHADPHPGNVFVRIAPPNKETGCKGGHTQAVILDHGLYTEFADEFRLRYASLWYSLVTMDTPAFEETCRKMGINHPDLFQIVLLMQSFDRVNLDKISEAAGTSHEDEVIEDNMQNDPTGPGFSFKHESDDDHERFVEMMHNLPIELHFLLRATFIQRALNQGLGAPVNRFSVMATEARNALVRSEGGGGGVSGTLGRWMFSARLIAWDYSVWIMDKLNLFEAFFRMVDDDDDEVSGKAKE